MNRAWIELDRKAIDYNLKLIKSFLDPKCKIMGVVKANDYGHGACIVANYLEKIGIDYFAVATEEESIELRESGVQSPILILGYTSPEKIGDLLKYKITQTITSLEYAKQLNECCRQLSIASPPDGILSVHIAVDSGMHRIGIPQNDIQSMIDVYQLPYLKVTGIFSHLSVADSYTQDDIVFTKEQIQSFFSVLRKLRQKGINVTCTHLQNSYACLNYTPLPFDYARLGILLLGLRSSDSDYLKGNPGLKPVLSLFAHITSIRRVTAGESVGYGRTFRAKEPILIASVAIGYADGIPRSLSGGKLIALLKGKLIHGVGRICMDQLMLDVSDIPDVHVGDVVTFIGQSGKLRIRAEEIANLSGTITNEFVSRLGKRLENRGFVD